MSAHERERLSAYLDGELPEVERTAVEAHLAACGECRDALAELAAIDEAAADLPAAAPDGYFDDFAARVRARIEARGALPSVPRRLPAWTWAVAAALVLAVVTPLSLREWPRAESKESVDAIDARSAVAPLSAAADAKSSPSPLPAAPAGPARLRLRSKTTTADASASGVLAGSGERTLAAPAGAQKGASPPVTAPAHEQGPQHNASAAKEEGGGAGFTAVPAPAAPAEGAPAAAEPIAAAEAQREDRPAAFRSAATSRDAATTGAVVARQAAAGGGAVAVGADAEYRDLVAARPGGLDAWRALRERWRAFAARWPDDVRADEARVRVVACGLEAVRSGGGEVDLETIRRDADAYLAHPDARQKERVRALAAAATSR